MIAAIQRPIHMMPSVEPLVVTPVGTDVAVSIGVAVAVPRAVLLRSAKSEAELSSASTAPAASIRTG